MEPMPQKQSLRNSRRLRANRTCSAILVHVEESVEVEKRQGEFLHLGRIIRIRIQEAGGQFLLSRRGSASGGKAPGVIDALDGRRAFLEEPLGQCRSQFVRSLAVEQF